MARQVVVLALAFLAIVALAHAADDKSKTATAPAPDDDEPLPGAGVVGTIGGDDDDELAGAPSSVVAGPIGGPVPPGVFQDLPALSPSDAPTVQFSAIAGATTAALAGFFYF